MVAIASSQTLLGQNSGNGSIDVINNRFHLAFITASILATIAALVAFVDIKKPILSGRKKEEIEERGTE
jgi:hypothetical protein